jgi:hypothetical protein
MKITFPMTDDWRGCYRDNWRDQISNEAFSHPAKFSRSLIYRIYDWLESQGHLVAGDTVIDPFGGVGLGAVDALSRGINWLGCELEARFVDLGQGCDCTGKSKADWTRFYGRWEKVNHKGGRHWCPRCIAEAKQIIPGQTSFFETAAYVQSSGKIPQTSAHRYDGNIPALFSRFRRKGAVARLLQGDSRRLGAVLAESGARAVVSSPPYVESLASDDPDTRGGLFTKDAKRRNDKTLTATYGTTPGQLGGLKAGRFDAAIMSPPFAGNSGGRGDASREGIDAALFDRHQGAMVGGIGAADNGNLAAMQARDNDLDAVIISSPFEDSTVCQDKTFWINDGRKTPPQGQVGYGTSPGQLGADSGDTFWSAARLILEQCHQQLALGGVAVFVTKDFVKNGRRMEFSQQWARLCVAVGFEPLAHFRAWLVEESAGQYNTGGELVTKTKSRKSFFRRLAEKNGSPSIDHEDVLIFQKQEAHR